MLSSLFNPKYVLNSTEVLLWEGLSNIKLKEEGRRGFKKEKLIEHFLLLSHNGTHEDIKVHLIGHCDRNDREDKVFCLGTLHSKRLNQKQALN